MKVNKCFSQKINNNSLVPRRRFLSLLSMIPMIGVTSYITDFKKPVNEDDLILVNGWILKKKDINAI